MTTKPCPACKFLIPQTALACAKCGHRLGNPLPEDMTSQAQPAATSVFNQSSSRGLHTIFIILSLVAAAIVGALWLNGNLTSTPSRNAENNTSPDSKNASIPPATLVKKIAAPSKRVFKHTGIIKTSYDKFTDSTMVQLDPLSLLGKSAYDDKGRLDMVVMFSHKGVDLITPSYLFLGFISASEDIRFKTDYDRRLYVLADGQRFDLGEMALNDSEFQRNKRWDNLTHYSESTWQLIPYETFLQIVNAKNVEMKIGNTEIRLSENHLEALRDIASRTVP
jgi:hypothetical protein